MVAVLEGLPYEGSYSVVYLVVRSNQADIAEPGSNVVVQSNRRRDKAYAAACIRS